MMNKDNPIQVTILVDNRADGELVPEHGLAMWIEADGRNILFDTGQGQALEPNCRALGIDLGKADTLVLSHGHYDHTGGLDQAVQAAPSVAIYCHSEAVRPRYAVRNGDAAAIHMPRSAMAALDKRPRSLLHWTPAPVMLSKNVGLTGPIPRVTDYEDVGGPFFLDAQGHRPDRLTDDMALWINTDDGVVVCVGCCHSGLVNTLAQVKKLSGCGHIRAVIGGFHLVNAGPERMERTRAALREIDPGILVPCHCTGDLALEALKNDPGLVVNQGHAGKSFVF